MAWLQQHLSAEMGLRCFAALPWVWGNLFCLCTAAPFMPLLFIRFQCHQSQSPVRVLWNLQRNELAFAQVRWPRVAQCAAFRSVLEFAPDLGRAWFSSVFLWACGLAWKASCDGLCIVLVGVALPKVLVFCFSCCKRSEPLSSGLAETAKGFLLVSLVLIKNQKIFKRWKKQTDLRKILCWAT